MSKNLYFFSGTLAHPYDYLTEGDWVAYDIYPHSPVVSIGKVTGFGKDIVSDAVTVDIYTHDGYVTRHFTDIKNGKMKKITNPIFMNIKEDK